MLEIDMAYLCPKFDHSSFSHFRWLYTQKLDNLLA